jgi:DNA replication protein DnaC
MSRIDRVLKKISTDTPRENMAISSNINPAPAFGRPDPNCPICHGVGFVSLDVPVSDPRFGRAVPCRCRKQVDGQATLQRLYDLSKLEAFKDMTFETFRTQGRMGLGEKEINSLELARNQAQQFAQGLKGWLLLTGGYGSGKTHLAAAAANFVVGLGVPVLFLTVPDLLDWLRFSYDDPDSSFEDRFDEIRNVRLLVLDDLGTQNVTPWAAEKLYQIIYHRYIYRLPTIITTNLELAELDGRIRSRLQDPDLVTSVRITAPDYRSPVRDAGQNTISTLALVSDHTFGNFSLRENEKLPTDQQKSLEKVFRAMQQFAEKPRGWLVILGVHGNGKTHLAAAIGNYRAAMGEEVIFKPVPDLLDHLRATFNPSSPISYDHLFEKVKTAPMLILDDLGTQTASPWAREKLFQLLNYRYEAKLPTVITSSNSLDELDDRIVSRMEDERLCAIYTIIAPSFRGGSHTTKRRAS